MSALRAGTSVNARSWAGRTVLVTGGLGFLGSHFTTELLASGARVLCLHRGDRFGRLAELPRTSALRTARVDLHDERALAAAVDAHTPAVDAVVHCAALDGNAEFKLKNSARILDTNLRFTSNVLNCARERRVRDVVLVSSAEVYRTDDSAPVAEDHDYRRRMRYAPDGYYLSKVFGEVLAELYRDQFGMNLFLARPTNVYGPRDGFHAPSGRVVPSMMACLARGQDIEVWGDGRQTRSFVHAADVAKATLQMVAANRHRTFNIGTGESVSIADLAHAVAEALDVPGRVRFLFDRPTGPSARQLDVSRMAGVVDFTPRSLAVGLRETADWFRARGLASGLAG
ncbi:NAD-dependent epimerase/dehydratase family protein [Actinosynnema sp.]|uniref:NAD-dependent epimerase/dehydratase family protein n=1 Tax=Actinosynnema sp. TaxID=1872144 RepID=UPI003F840C1A